MSCSSVELKDYFFGELGPAERSSVESHISGCAACRDELTALAGTRTALLSLPDEEPLRRIAFVSDKVFQPRWWQRFWASGSQLGFAAAAMLAVAIVAHAFMLRPGPSVGGAPGSVSLAEIQADADRRVKVEVAKALADNEARQLGKLLEVVDAKLKDADERRNTDLVLIREYLERLDKRGAIARKAAFYE